MTDDENKAEAAVVKQSPQQLALRASLVKRGLQEIETATHAQILVVNDEEKIRLAICEILESKGYQCLAVAGGLDAIELLEGGEKIDLIVHDLLNPQIDGANLLLRLREEFPNIPVIVATAVHDVAAIFACLQAGASDYVCLPNVDQLQVAVHRALEVRSERIPLTIEELKAQARLSVFRSNMFDSENPILVLSLDGYYEEPAKGFSKYHPGMRCLVFYGAELENLDQHPHCVAQGLCLFRRSLLTDEVFESPDGAYLQPNPEYGSSVASSPGLNLPPQSVMTVTFELIYIFEEGLSADQCVEWLFDSSEVFAFDAEHSKAIIVKAS